MRNGTPSNDNSRNGISSSNVSPSCQDINFYGVAGKRQGTHRCRSGLSNFFCKCLDLPIEDRPPPSLLLFHLNFVFITIPVFTFTISSLVKLDISSFPEELDILKNSVKGKGEKDQRRDNIQMFFSCQ